MANSPYYVPYYIAKKKLDDLVDNLPLNLKSIDRESLEKQAMTDRPKVRVFQNQSIEQRCVNYLRHCSSDYNDAIRELDRPDFWVAAGIHRHIWHVERPRCVARIKERVLDEIAQSYPWLSAECCRQKLREGVESNPGDYVLTWGPFKGRRLRDLDTDYLLRLLGQSSTMKSYRTRIERVLAGRYTGA